MNKCHIYNNNHCVTVYNQDVIEDEHHGNYMIMGLNMPNSSAKAIRCRFPIRDTVIVEYLEDDCDCCNDCKEDEEDEEDEEDIQTNDNIIPISDS